MTAPAPTALRRACVVGGHWDFIQTSMAGKLARRGLEVRREDHVPVYRSRFGIPSGVALIIVLTDWVDIPRTTIEQVRIIGRSRNVPVLNAHRQFTKAAQQMDSLGFPLLAPVAGAALNDEETGAEMPTPAPTPTEKVETVNPANPEAKRTYDDRRKDLLKLLRYMRTHDNLTGVVWTAGGELETSRTVTQTDTVSLDEV